MVTCFGLYHQAIIRSQVNNRTCHFVTLNNINIHNISWVLTWEFLLLICIHRTQGDESAKYMQQYQNFIIPYFKWSSTCFGRKTVHHQKPLVLHAWKVVGRAIVRRCQVMYVTWQRLTSSRPTTFHTCKIRGCLYSFRLLMMGGVSSETRWASFKIKNNKILIHCFILLGFLL
jgi:hypothetical protein